MSDPIYKGFYQAQLRPDGTYEVEKVKLDGSHYIQAMINLKSLDETGAGADIQAARRRLP